MVAVGVMVAEGVIVGVSDTAGEGVNACPVSPEFTGGGGVLDGAVVGNCASVGKTAVDEGTGSHAVITHISSGSVIINKMNFFGRR